MVREVNSDMFSEMVLASDKPVVVDFWASWCGPCMRLAPILEEVAESMPEVDFIKVNTEVNHELAAQYEVTSIPNLTIFKEGEVIGQMVGLQPAKKISKNISKILKNS